MKRIACEVCGSNQLIKEDGYFQCEFCGTKYSLDEARKLMVGGTVEITKGNAERDRLLSNAKYFIEHKQFVDALKTIEKLKFDFPADKNVEALENDYCLEKSLYDFIDEKNTIIKKMNLFFFNPKDFMYKRIEIGKHFSAINSLRQTIVSLNRSYNLQLTELENEIINEYNMHNQSFFDIKNSIMFEIVEWANGIVVGQYHTSFNSPPKINSETIDKWTKLLVQSEASLIQSGQLSVMSLGLHLKEVFFEIPKMDSSFVSQNILFSILYEGIQCGNYLDSHTYIFEDVISDVSPLIFSSYRKTIVFVLANRLLYLYDTDYGIFDYRELPTKRAINCIKDLEVIANTKNPNSFCQKCGSRLAGFFSRRCPRCDK